MEYLLEKINQCSSDEEVNKLIQEALENCIKNSEKKELGFPRGSIRCSAVYKGFIHPESRIRFDSMSMMSYSMRTMDFYYEFGRLIYKNKIRDISNLIGFLMKFINNYFGINNGKDLRDDFFSYNSFGVTKTDDELFKAIDNFEIGNLKGRNLAMCSDRSALAQNILSLFGLETYYCIGCASMPDREEGHCFNVVRAKNGYRIVDYSMFCGYYQNDYFRHYLPLVNDIPVDEVEGFLFDNKEVVATVYEYNKSDDGLKKEKIKDIRYLIGKTSFDKNDSRANQYL